MSLGKIKNTLYAKEAPENLSEHSHNEFDFKSRNQKDLFVSGRDDVWEKGKKGLGGEQKKAVKWGAIIIGGLAVVILGVFGVFKYMQSSFSENRVSIQIGGPTDASSGKLLAFEIKYTNNNRAVLKGAILRLTYPESFKPGENSNFKTEGRTSGTFALGDIAGNSSGKVILNGNAYSPKGTLMYLKADLIYTPSNFNSQFVTKNQLGINIDSSPIDLEIMAPQKVASGDSVDYEITFTNTGKEDFDGIQVKADYPETFAFTRSAPGVSEGKNIWYVGNLAAGQKGKIVISGVLQGGKDEMKIVKAYIGTNGQDQFYAYSEEQASTTMISAPIYIVQTVNGSSSYNAKAGETLNFKISYRNDNNIDLRNVILTEKIDSPVLDYASLQSKKGGFDPNNKILTWKAVDYPTLKNLAPGQKGEVEFSIKVKEVIPVTTANDKNYVISAIAKIDSPDIQTPISSNKIVSGNTLEIKLNSKLIVDAKGYYNDKTISNLGPIPPKVGETTSYTIHWKIINISNDITDAKVTASLPTGVTMTGKINPDDGKLTFNSRDNSLVWDLGKVASGTGILNAPPEIAFQIQVTPAQNQFDTMPALVGPVTFSAKDVFTGDDLQAMADAKTTGFIEDSELNSNYKVVK